MQFGPPLVDRLSTVLLQLSGTDTDTHIFCASSDPFVVRSATMAEKRRGPPSRGRPYIWPPRLTDDAPCDAGTQTDKATMAERRRRVEDMTTAVDTLIKYQKTYNKKYTQEEADGLVQKALMRDRAETLQLYFEMLPEVADGGMFGMLFCRKSF